MKNIMSGIRVLPVAALLLVSCLEEDPRYSQNSSTVFSTESNAELALLGCYGYLSHNYAYGQMWQEVPVTGSGVGWYVVDGSDDSNLSRLDIAIRNTTVNYAWMGMYKVISEVNAFLNSLDESLLDEDAKIQMGGEAKFLRALCYYNLVAHWGDVPLRLTVTTSDDIDAPRTDKEEVFSSIVDDLIAAKEIEETADVGRATSWAAKALLGKVYYKMAMLDIDASGNLQNAKTLFDEVYASGVYALEPDIDDLFRPFTSSYYAANSREVIFQVNFDNEDTGNCYNRACNRFAPASSTSGVAWGSRRCSRYFYDFWYATYPGDPRLETSYLTSWRSRDGNSYDNPKTPVGSVLCPGDSTYAYPRWLIGSGDTAWVFHMPYEVFTDPSNPDPDELQAYLDRLYDMTEDGHYTSFHNNTIKNFYESLINSGSNNKFPYNAKVYDEGAKAQLSNMNLPVLRYAEILLLMADVYNELGNTNRAIELVNEVLVRARNSYANAEKGLEGVAAEPADWSYSLSQDEVREKLYYERIFELMNEPDLFDMCRIKGTGFFKDLLTREVSHKITIAAAEYYNENKANWGDYLFNDGNLTDDFVLKNMLLPIPGDEIDANPGITYADNNYGYATAE